MENLGDLSPPRLVEGPGACPSLECEGPNALSQVPRMGSGTFFSLPSNLCP